MSKPDGREQFGRVDTQQLYLDGTPLPIVVGNKYYVDPSTGADTNGGKSWSNAFATVQQACETVTHYDTIFVKGATQSGLISEAVTGPTSDIRNVSIIGVGPTCRGIKWKSSSTSAPCLTLNYKGWRVMNIRFEGPTGAAAIKANRIAASSYDASDFLIGNCEFYTGAAGLELVGAPHGWKVLHSRFRSITGALASGITTTGCIVCNNTAHSVPMGVEIAYCEFLNSKNGLVVPLTDSALHHCRVQAQGVDITMTTKVDLRGVGGTTISGRNQVYSNVLGGTYSHNGGYQEAANDEWFDNYVSTGVSYALPG